MEAKGVESLLPAKLQKLRLDVLLTQSGAAASRETARRMILAGEVRVNGETVDRPGTMVRPDVALDVRIRPRYASRGGEKLRAALDRFAIDPTGWVCADVGASTGGFTDCLLQAGAAKVYAIDVGYGQLAWKLRQDDRVVIMEKVNARYLERLPEPVNIACVDASFISLKLLMPVIGGWLTSRSMIIALIKPQFEAGRREVSKGGVVRDPMIHRRVIMELIAFAQKAGFVVSGLMASPLIGPSGNREFLLWLGGSEAPISGAIEQWVDEAINSAHEL